MKVLGKIRTVCDARTWMYNGSPIVSYPIIFDGEGGEFVGDMYASEETLKRRGIKESAIGTMEIEFKVREAKRSNGDTYPAQQVRFKDFRLANAGIFNDNAPAASGGDASVSTKEQKLEQPVTADEDGDLVF